jgi:hypothetical protein
MNWYCNQFACFQKDIAVTYYVLPVCVREKVKGLFKGNSNTKTADDFS